ncbi:MAG: hypothetical protein M3P70_00720 [Actinomycetota bacterium]|nr:hypothetical protein [Actinomycetota bacterium]
MDDQGFDRLARSLAAGTSRRRVLAGMAAAALGGLGLRHVGAQASDEPVSCGGIAGLPCPEGFTCVDDPSDNCNPATGGADCLGICRPMCGEAVCGAEEYCCNESCSICAPIGGSCTEQFCGDQCQSDADCPHRDGDACTGAACEEGTCVYFTVDCVPGFVCCGNGECVDVSSDPANCGACGTVCDSGVCSDGTCSPTGEGCDEGEVDCDGTCVATCCDNNNCGGCGIVCGDGETCFEGVCDCPSGQCEEPGDTSGGTSGGTSGVITTLPSTGSGSASTGRHGGLAATALAAAAALGAAAVRRASPRWRDE